MNHIVFEKKQTDLSRSKFLDSIHKGTKLNKTETNDRSNPDLSVLKEIHQHSVVTNKEDQFLSKKVSRSLTKDSFSLRVKPIPPPAPHRANSYSLSASDSRNNSTVHTPVYEPTKLTKGTDEIIYNNLPGNSIKPIPPVENIYLSNGISKEKTNLTNTTIIQNPTYRTAPFNIPRKRNDFSNGIPPFQVKDSSSTSEEVIYNNLPGKSIVPVVPKTVQKVRAKYEFKAQTPKDMSFSKGDIIIVEKNNGQWWFGRNQNNGNIGIFPSNYVELLSNEDFRVARLPVQAAGTKNILVRSPSNSLSNIPQLTPILPPNISNKSILCIALFDFQAEQEGDLTFKINDIIKIIKQQGPWWEGELNGHTGLFPSNYVRVL